MKSDVVITDYMTEIKKISDYYKGRYEKALSIGIHEGSKHYKAFLEIKLRYTATEMALEVLESIKKLMNKDDFKRNVFGGVKLIINVLTVKEQRIIATGEMIWTQPKIVIRKDDTETRDIFFTAKNALQKLSELDYSGQNREDVFYEVIKYTYDIVIWLIISRELVFRVGREWNAS